MARLYTKKFMGFMSLRLGVFVRIGFDPEVPMLIGMHMQIMSLMSIIGGIFVAVPAWLQIASIRML